MQKRKIKFGDVVFDRAARERIENILDTGRNTEGKFVETFEHGFAEKFGYDYAVMTSSGTTAGEVLWMSICDKLQIAWGSQLRVITPALAFVATANCFLRRGGLEPHFVDICDDLNMSDEGLFCTYALGVQFVLNMGRTVRMDRVAEFAKLYHLPFFVDACEGHGAMLNGKRVADYADAAIYSFYPAHIMTVGGEAGMICTRDKKLADLCRSIKSHGRPVGTIEHDFERIGTNAKTTEIAAAVGLSALENFDENFKRRRYIRQAMLDRLEGFPVTVFPDAPGEVIAPHAFPILINDAFLFDAFKAHLKEWQIEFKPLWGSLTEHGAYSWYPWQKFPVAREIGKRGVHWGCHESLNVDDLDYLYDVMALFFRDYREAA